MIVPDSGFRDAVGSLGIAAGVARAGSLVLYLVYNISQAFTARCSSAEALVARDRLEAKDKNI